MAGLHPLSGAMGERTAGAAPGLLLPSLSESVSSGMVVQTQLSVVRVAGRCGGGFPPGRVRGVRAPKNLSECSLTLGQPDLAGSSGVVIGFGVPTHLPVSLTGFEGDWAEDDAG